MIRYIANRTFTIYLFHFPLLLFFASILNHNPKSYYEMSFLFVIVLISCIFLASFTENKKYFYKKQITSLWNIIEGKIKK